MVPETGKIKIAHFHNGNEGGVLSVIRNLLQFSVSPDIENHVIHTINKNKTQNYQLQNLKGVVSEQVFYYSPDWNFYHTCRQLAKLLPDENCVIVAHDWLELGMVSNLGLQNPLVQIVHGDYDYYYELAQKHEPWIDRYIAVTKNIKDELSKYIPAQTAIIKYIRFPVPESHCDAKLSADLVKIIFIGRQSREKGYHLLPGIAKLLADRGIQVEWNIVGAADNEMAQIKWDPELHVIIYGTLINEAVHDLLCKMDFIILPSVAEGMPVTLIEAMKAGVIPLVNDLPGGIQELIINDENGYKIKDNEPCSYAEILIQLLQERERIPTMKKKNQEIADRLFDPYINTVAYEQEFINVSNEKPKFKTSQKIYGSRLDTPWIPNAVTRLIRKMFPNNRTLSNGDFKENIR